MSTVVPAIALLVLALLGAYVVMLGLGYVSNNIRALKLFEAEKALLSARIDHLNERLQTLDPGSGALAWSGIRKFMLVG